MTDANIVEVTDREGWRREFSLTKSIVYIGSGPGNDVLLDPRRGGGVSARHLQLISVAGGEGYRLINVGDTEVRLGADGAQGLAPRAFVEIGPGQQIQVGEFRLVFQGGADGDGAASGGYTGGGSDRVSKAIGLSLTLPSTELLIGKPIDGSVTVRNLGDQAGVQIKLEVDGLDPACVEMGPGPILFPNAEKEVMLRLHHPRAARPLAGPYRIRVRATAPAAYPGEVASVSQLINIGPYYSHTVNLAETT